MSTELGRRAEDMAIDYLEARGYRILVRNWRNRWCELDIVAQNAQGIHFVEVKYRRFTNYGLAVEYITHDKTDRLRRAAEAWVQAHGYRGSFQIDVMSIEGDLDKSPTFEFLLSVVESL